MTTFHTRVFSIPLTGGAGVASGSVAHGVAVAAIRAVQVKYYGQPGTTDVNVIGEGDGVQKTILALSNTSVNLPMTAITEAAIGSTGAPTSDLEEPLVYDKIVAMVSQGDPADPGVVLTVVLEY